MEGVWQMARTGLLDTSTTMTSNAQRFANLVCELRSLLENYFEVTKDNEADPLTYYAIFNLYLSIQILDQYAIHDSVAIEFLKSLSDRHKEVLDKIQKN
jgi:hypothetical protein